MPLVGKCVDRVLYPQDEMKQFYALRWIDLNNVGQNVGRFVFDPSHVLAKFFSG